MKSKCRFDRLTDLAAEFRSARLSNPTEAGSTTEYPTNHTQKPTTYTHKTTANNAGGGAYIYYGLAVPLG
ncbi:MAG: hypothetical protein ACON4A_03720 [Flavobacteriaceae bacterium]